MEWTKERPTQPGLYLLAADGWGVWLCDFDGKVWLETEDRETQEEDLLMSVFLGPLPSPPEDDKP